MDINLLLDIFENRFSKNMERDIDEYILENYSPRNYKSINDMLTDIKKADELEIYNFLCQEYDLRYIKKEYDEKTNTNENEYDEYQYEDEIFNNKMALDELLKFLKKQVVDYAYDNKEEYNKDILNIENLSEAKDLDDEIGDKIYLNSCPDAGSRDGAFIDIDHKIIYKIDGSITHSNLIAEYFHRGKQKYERTNAERILKEEDIEQFAFGNICNNIILIDPSPNMSFKEVIKDLKESDISFEKIYCAEEEFNSSNYIERVANLNRL